MPYGTVVADVIQNTTGYSLGAGNASTMKNRIINGAMVVAQRGTGSFSNDTTGTQYTVDRFLIYGTVASKFTAQQNAGSVTTPVGFTNYLGITSSSAYSIGSTDQFVLIQRIEGFNTADLGWGTADAKTITLSFQVRSSLTGTFGGSLVNAGGTRSYPFSYSIPAANTWTTISVTIAGDTTGTWGTGNGTGIQVNFGLGVGSTLSGTAGSWAGTNYSSATGATSVVGTNGATFYITGVQLEVGSSATGYEYRQYGQEFALCQRYYYKRSLFYTNCLSTTDVNARITLTHPVEMRAVPTITGVAGSGTFSADQIYTNQATYTTLGVGAGNYGVVNSATISVEL